MRHALGGFVIMRNRLTRVPGGKTRAGSSVPHHGYARLYNVVVFCFILHFRSIDAKECCLPDGDSRPDEYGYRARYCHARRILELMCRLE